MGVNAEAASGLIGNAGKASSGLDEAITAAFAASESPSETEVRPDRSAESSKVEETAPETESAGDDAKGEKAPQPKTANKLESTKDTGAQEAPKVFEAPKHWSEADRSAFAGLPDDAKGIVSKLAKNLEGGFTRKSQELSDKAKFADGVRGLFNETDRNQLVQAGTDEVGVMRYLLDRQRHATTDPVGYVKWAMQALGVPPDKLGFSQASKPDEQKAPDDIEALLRDPKVTDLEAKLAKLEQWKTERETYEQRQQREAYQLAQDGINRAFADFRSEQDDAGQLKYPHFDTVMPQMGALMQTDPDLLGMPDTPDKLEKAYDRAVWARPDLRQSFLEQEAQKRTQETEKRQAAERAKRVTAVKPAVNAGTSKSRHGSLDDALSAAFSKHGL